MFCVYVWTSPRLPVFCLRLLFDTSSSCSSDLWASCSPSVLPSWYVSRGSLIPKTYKLFLDLQPKKILLSFPTSFFLSLVSFCSVPLLCFSFHLIGPDDPDCYWDDYCNIFFIDFHCWKSSCFFERHVWHVQSEFVTLELCKGVTFYSFIEAFWHIFPHTTVTRLV